MTRHPSPTPVLYNGRLRANWRQIPVVELTDDEVAQMSPAELRWASDLLLERHQKRQLGKPA